MRYAYAVTAAMLLGGAAATVALQQPLGAQVAQTVDAIASRWRAERRFIPTMSRERARDLVERWEHAVRQAVCE